MQLKKFVIPVVVLFLAGISIAMADSSTVNSNVFLVSSASNVGIGTTSPYALFAISAIPTPSPYFVIGSSTSEVFKISPSASAILGIGTSTPVATLAVNPVAGGALNQFIVGSSTATNFQIDNSGHIFAPNTTGSGANQTGYWCYDATGQLIRDTTTCLVSAAKFKTDIQTLSEQYGLNAVMQLRPVTYLKKQPLGTDDHGQQIGLIADEVNKVIPQLVTHDSTGEIHGFNYEQYTAVLTKAIQDQQKQINELQKEVEALKK